MSRLHHGDRGLPVRVGDGRGGHLDDVVELLDDDRHAWRSPRRRCPSGPGDGDAPGTRPRSMLERGDQPHRGDGAVDGGGRPARGDDDLVADLDLAHLGVVHRGVHDVAVGGDDDDLRGRRVEEVDERGRLLAADGTGQAAPSPPATRRWSRCALEPVEAEPDRNWNWNCCCCSTPADRRSGRPRPPCRRWSRSVSIGQVGLGRCQLGLRRRDRCLVRSDLARRGIGCLVARQLGLGRGQGRLG